MVKRKTELHLRVQHVCESMEISMARLEQSSKEIENCDTMLIIPKVEEYLKRKRDLLRDVSEFQSRIESIESELSDSLLLEYKELVESVTRLRAEKTVNSESLFELTSQNKVVNKKLAELNTQIDAQKREVASKKEVLVTLEISLEEKKKAVLEGCETLRQFQIENLEANTVADEDLKKAQFLFDEAKCEVQTLTEDILTETGKLVNASECHNIIANKRLQILQQLSDLKKQEETLLKRIKEDESTIQTEEAETKMLENSISVTNSSIEVQKKMKDNNDNQVMGDVMDFNVSDEIAHLEADLINTENTLRQIESQLESGTHPELLDIIKKVQEATNKQKALCDNLVEARACVQELDRALEQKRAAEASIAARMEIVLSEIEKKSTANATLAASIDVLTAEHTQLQEEYKRLSKAGIASDVLFDDTSSVLVSKSSSSSTSSSSPSSASMRPSTRSLGELQTAVEEKQQLLQEKENMLQGMEQQKARSLAEQRSRRIELRQAAVAKEGNKRFETKKRVLREFQESEISSARNRLEEVGSAYTRDAKKKEHAFLQEKNRLEQEHSRLLEKSKSKKGAASSSSSAPTSTTSTTKKSTARRTRSTSASPGKNIATSTRSKKST
mmetsp:Transcript_10329/g.19231  ORF Transcript_10329/g.19231 Transcript_10329/m.19231 type:complete len:618 (-) Transcript_10329:334-2187(-)